MDKKGDSIQYTKYQQGDVVMYKIDEKDLFSQEQWNGHLKSSATNQKSYSGKTNTKAVMAFGEVTGHTHRVEMKDMLKEAGVTLHMGYNNTAGKDVPNAFEVHETDVEIIHEEHNPVKLPPGKYVVKIVREFNHLTRRAQNVAD